MDDETMQETWVRPFIPTYRSVVQYGKSTLDAYLLGLFMAYHARFQCLLGVPENPSDTNSAITDLAHLLLRVYTKLSDTQDSPTRAAPDSLPTGQHSDPPVKVPIHTQHASHTPPTKNDSLVPVPSSSKLTLPDALPSSTVDLGMPTIPHCIISETFNSSGQIGGKRLMTGSKRTHGSSSDGKEEPTSKRRCQELGAVSSKARIHINFR
ncbi:hypothetical protein ARMGADRAFT_1033420 [Armillaria gallica]|uniref:Uncharacterized protein n=1 Tax=Armillaria gallica TaxID=47427 RepID=A0A2H3D293_ARMGA|nr:hypothetical protein ARMGADRAFT_1033420 [Armillaria gallica]